MLPITASGQSANTKLDDVLRKIGGEAIRGVDSDICFPATATEYEALGKNAIVMLKSSSALSTELPLRTAYVIYKGVRIPLQRVAILSKQVDEGSSRATQLSFYLLPLNLMKSDAVLMVDFTGDRKGFSVMSFHAKLGLGPGAPAFVRLDEYDTPADADPATVQRVLEREYPDYIK
jgi:hypothetical protein